MNTLMRRFRQIVFALVVLSTIAFCLAEQNMGLLFVAVAVAGGAWIVSEVQQRFLPRWFINLAAIAAILWFAFEVVHLQPGRVIIAMGHFTISLQVLLLYSKMTNREYGEVLVLSAVQMIGASILSASIFFATLLMIYCVLVLLGVLLYQLKVVADRVAQQQRDDTPADRPESRVQQRAFYRSTASVGAGCALVACVTFVLLPRTSRFDDFGGWNRSLGSRQVGFNAQVRLDGLQPSQGNTQQVLTLELHVNGRPVGSDGEAWLLRGAAMDMYDVYSRTWTRSRRMHERDNSFTTPATGLELAVVPEGLNMIDASITQRRGESRMTLFTLYPTTSISSSSLQSIWFNTHDMQVTGDAGRASSVSYRLQAPINPSDAVLSQIHQDIATRNAVNDAGNSERNQRLSSSRYARGWLVNADEIRELTLRVIRDAGLDRDIAALHDPNDEAIALALVDYLRQNYTYSLRNPPTRDEPVSEFLFRQRRGHCELFATALAAMTRSIGMQARVITGYLASEFNTIGGYYVVRQSNAHAWCEIFVPEVGWKTFDATPPAALAAEHAVTRGWSRTIINLYEHLELIWLQSVVAYDKETRYELLAMLRSFVSDDAVGMVKSILTGFAHYLYDQSRFRGARTLLLVMILCVVSAASIMLIRTSRNHRRTRQVLHMSLISLKDQREMVRQLGFYMNMLSILDRHGFDRPSWVSPLAYAQQLRDLDPERFSPVVTLTQMFYEVRFGQRELNEQHQNLATTQLLMLEQNLRQRASADVVTN